MLALFIKIGTTYAEELTLIAITNHWRYDRSGADLSGQFNQRNFDGSSWPQGQALLGHDPFAPFPYPYPVRTPLLDLNGPITYYFRAHFDFPFSADGVTLIASNYVDDGAVYYLNGVEVGRIRIGPGPVNASTLASNAVPEGQAVVLSFPSETLVASNNILAVEVHQTSPSNVDIMFGMSLLAKFPEAGPVTITIHPTSRTVEEGQPTSFATSISGSPPHFHQWFHNNAPISGATNRSFTITATTPADAGNYVLAVSNLFSTAISSNAMLRVNPIPSEFFSLSKEWRFNASGTQPNPSWIQPAFDDTEWAAGRGVFCDESIVLPTPVNTLLPRTNNAGRRIVTYYFRTHFEWEGDTNFTALTVRMLIDDGAVFYLNGSEVARVRLPPSPEVIVYEKRPSSPVPDTTHFEVITVSPGALVSGDNVLAVEVHQADDSENDVVFGAALGQGFPVVLPDLIISPESALPSVFIETFEEGTCEILEGCAVAGTRRLLRFNTETRNIGNADLFLGNPAGNPLFVLDPCHGHFHYNDYAEYRLRDPAGLIVAGGGKIGFCLLDGFQWDENANSNPIYDCDNQGIQAGWADVYANNLPCQWVDITGVPAGAYTLEIEVDPNNRILESDELNNVASVNVTIEEPCHGPPPNDNFDAAQSLAYVVATATVDTDCATRETGEAEHPDSSGGHSVWYRWTAPSDGFVTVTTDGSNFDTILAAYRGSSVANLALVAYDDDGGEDNASRILLNARAGEIYYFAVDGYGSASGDAVLNLNPGGNDAFSRCLALPDIAGSVSGYSASASKESGEPNHAGHTGGRSVWFCWTATTTRSVELNTVDSRFDTVLAVYTGANLASLDLVASDDNSLAGNLSKVIFDAIAGTTYRIAVDDVRGDGGVFFLHWRPATYFLPPQLLPNNSLQITITGGLGDRYAIDTSSNLTSWTLWRRLTNTSVTMELIEPNVGDTPSRFFRLRPD